MTEEALAVRRILAGSDPERFAPDLAMSLTNYGAHLAELDLSGQGRRNEALAALQEAASLYESLARSLPERFLPSLAQAHDNLGVVLREMQRFEEAVEATARAIKLYRTLAGPRPGLFLPHLVDALADTSVALVEAGRLEEAEAALAEAAALVPEDADAPDSRRDTLLQARADVLRLLGAG